ncbi:hypothetical protein SDC9_140738 [bioreactor metagenome]|uniref:Uncharacterized protein n=1 Tax=bioreactor metagenome TaxID=1076179 RepID=A0A645DWU7_9ZZZZ
MGSFPLLTAQGLLEAQFGTAYLHRNRRRALHLDTERVFINKMDKPSLDVHCRQGNEGDLAIDAPIVEPIGILRGYCTGKPRVVHRQQQMIGRLKKFGHLNTEGSG